MGGNGVICPGCEKLLAIPSEENEQSIKEISEADYANTIKKEKKKNLEKRRKSKSVRGHHEWASSPNDLGEKSIKVMIPIAIISLLLIGVLLFFIIPDSKDTTGILNNPQVLDHGSFLAPIDQVAPPSDTSPPSEVYLYDAEDENKVKQLEEFFNRMYAAKTIDEMIPYVRPVDGIREKMTHHYKGKSPNESQFKEINFARSSDDATGYLSFECQTQDYKIHYGFIKYTKDEILLDWESYVAYSEMTWEELAKKKPTKPFKLRVSANKANFYNDEFAKEKEWQSVALTNPNEEESIYGYVKRGTATYQQLFNFGLSDNRDVILEVYFPKDARAGNQVFIDRVVEQGWLIKDEK
jgi:hypothetical protein